MSLENVFPVQMRDVSKIYRSGRTGVSALSDVSLQVSRGEFLTIMGASGSGKSTLLHLLAGLTEKTSGTILIDGEDLSKMSDRDRTTFRRRKLGIVFQSFNLIPTLTARENILLPMQIEGISSGSARVEELMERLEIQDRSKHRPDSLSGGEQQRVAIARALVMEPSLLLADEPTGNLDSENSEKLCRSLRELCDVEKRTLILVTHDAVVASWGDRRITLKDGRVSEETDIRVGKGGRE